MMNVKKISSFFPVFLVPLESATYNSLNHLMWTVALCFSAALPHFFSLPWFMSFYLLFVIALRFAMALQKVVIRKKILPLLLFVLGLLIIYLQYKSLTNRGALVAFLSLVIFLKLYEIHSHRDLYVVNFFSIFLMFTNFLVSQPIILSVYLIFVLYMAIVHLVLLNQPLSQFNPRLAIKQTAPLLLQALPLAILLFYLFPRFPGNFWRFPQDPFGSAKSGLSELMQPGTISQLSLSDDIAFRVRFIGQAPPQETLYWRGAILWNYAGGAWFYSDTPVMTQAELKAKTIPYQYVVTLEPHNRKWLLLLDMPSDINGGNIQGDFQGLSLMRIRTVYQYEATSWLRYIASPTLSKEERNAGIRLPSSSNPRTRQLAQSFLAPTTTDEQIVQKAMNYFKNNPFRYTLTPPIMENQPIDRFLFDEQSGFCEHYSSAFTYLMRLANIPARVVTGYLGGEYNPVGNYYVVRQADAHAWSEVWLHNKGWVRVDPTTWIAPERIEKNVQQSLLRNQTNVLNMPQLTTLAHYFDSMHEYWNEWVIGYEGHKQWELFSHFGLQAGAWEKLIYWLGGSILTFILGLMAWLQWRDRPLPKDRAWQLYEKFCHYLAKQGIERFAFEGPLDFATRAKTHLPHLIAHIESITKYYIQCRYHPNPDQNALMRLNQAIRRLMRQKNIVKPNC